MFLNQDGKKFVDVTYAGGFGNLQKGHGVAFTDLDNDGQQDVLIAMGGAYQSDRYYPEFFHNPGFPNHWITLRLKGTRANKLGIGARVKATFSEAGRTRDVYQTCGKGGTFGANSLQVHLGLGQAKKIDALEVLWPGDKEPERFKDVAVDSFYAVTQDSGKLEKLNLPKIKFSTEDMRHAQHHH
jgi:hypothetical protein